MRIILTVGFALPVLAAPWPQFPGGQTPDEIHAAELADMRGQADTLETAAENARKQWLSVVGPNRNSPVVSIGAVSAKRLRHSVPKAARKAYEKAFKGRDPKDIADGLKTAIKIDPDFADAHCDLGVAYSQLLQYPEAEAEFRRAIELVPEESLPHSNLAWILIKLGRRAEAEASARRALQLSPENAAAHLLIGRLLLEASGDRPEGFRHLQYAARTIPEAKELLEILGRK